METKIVNLKTSHSKFNSVEKEVKSNLDIYNSFLLNKRKLSGYLRTGPSCKGLQP